MKKAYRSVFYKLINHKEVNSKDLRKLRRKFSKVDIIVIKHTKGTFGFSKPCLECTKILQLLGLNKVYYTNEDGTGLIMERVCNIRTEHLSQSQRAVNQLK